MRLAPMRVHWPIANGSRLGICDGLELVKGTDVIENGGIIPQFRHKYGGYLALNVPVQKVEVEVWDIGNVRCEKRAGQIELVTVCD